MINNVVLVGRLTADADLRYTPSGKAVAKFTLAVKRKFSNGQGEKETDFIRCEVWGKSAENTAQFVGKGSLVGVEGSIRTGSYEDKEGKRVYTTDINVESIQFLEPKGNRTNSAPQQNNQSSNHSRVEEDPFSSNSGPINVSDDDLPF